MFLLNGLKCFFSEKIFRVSILRAQAQSHNFMRSLAGYSFNTGTILT